MCVEERSRKLGTRYQLAPLSQRLPSRTASAWQPFGNAVFDGVIGMNVLPHIDDLTGTLNELARVLRPGCRAVFVEPGLDHLTSNEAQRAIREHGENDMGFDVFEFLQLARTRGFDQAMVTATLQSALRLLPVQELDLFRSGRHPRPHITAHGVLDELYRRHAYAMLVRDGYLKKPPRKPGEKPWWSHDYANARKIRDRQLFAS